MFTPIAETMGQHLQWNQPSTNRGLAERRNMEGAFVAGIDEPVRPALSHDLVLGPEAKALLAVLADVAEARALPAAEAVVADRHRNGHVHADHADVHASGEFARGVAVPCEDRDSVAILVLGGKADSFLEILGADH